MNRPLRFCMITTFYPPYNFGGDGIFVHQLSNELARRGHHVEVIHCEDAYRSLAQRGPTDTYEDHPSVTVHRLKSPFGFLSPLATQQTGFPLFKTARIRQILDAGFDVIHYHNISLVGGPKILAYGRGIKLYTLHEYWLVCPTHLLFKFNREPCDHKQCIACSLTYHRPPQWWRYSGLLETSLKHVDAVLSPSRFGQEIHQQMGLEIPIVHLPNFIPTERLGAAPTAPPNGQDVQRPYFLFVGRLEKIKGLQTIIPLFRQYPDVRLVMAGRGNFESELRQLAQGSPNIQFVGYQSGEALQSLYRKAVAVVVPSICYELFPLVILESFREGTPVIVRNIGGLPEIIEASGGGLVFNTEDELARGMKQLLTNPSERDTLSQRGHLAYERNWGVETHMERYLALIHQFMKRGERALC